MDFCIRPTVRFHRYRHMLIELQRHVHARTIQMPDELSIDEIDKVLQELENSLDIRTSEQKANVFEIRDSKEHSASGDGSLLRFECPTDLWEEFTEYCKRNELDPAQQVREAVIGYYKNLWQTYKIRRKLYDDSQLI
jgi:hypothetical protein